VPDNAHSAEQIRPLLPGAAGCMVVVTSRDSLSAAHLGLGQVALDHAERGLPPRRHAGDLYDDTGYPHKAAEVRRRLHDTQTPP